MGMKKNATSHCLKYIYLPSRVVGKNKVLFTLPLEWARKNKILFYFPPKKLVEAAVNDDFSHFKDSFLAFLKD